jgi:hypothetical protein
MAEPIPLPPMFEGSHDVMRALAEHAKTLGWEIAEWSWKDDIDGDAEYQLWLRPIETTEGAGDAG